MKIVLCGPGLWARSAKYLKVPIMLLSSDRHFLFQVSWWQILSWPRGSPNFSSTWRILRSTCTQVSSSRLLSGTVSHQVPPVYNYPPNKFVFSAKYRLVCCTCPIHIVLFGGKQSQKLIIF